MTKKIFNKQVFIAGISAAGTVGFTLQILLVEKQKHLCATGLIQLPLYYNFYKQKIKNWSKYKLENIHFSYNCCDQVTIC